MDTTGSSGDRARHTDLAASTHLVGRVAHGFKNVLTVINACTELARDSLPHDNPVREAADEIHLAGLRGFQLSRELFALSKTCCAIARRLHRTPTSCRMAA
ncbi:MAG TPA: hypothetical protein VKR61_08600 [Bryobacteraceae bacterium]|nr:hypothetical protein [Bryobacteraceae bacterium]